LQKKIKDVENNFQVNTSGELTFGRLILRILEEQVEASVKLFGLLEEAIHIDERHENK
jgi:hypothetical protein